MTNQLLSGTTKGSATAASSPTVNAIHAGVASPCRQRTRSGGVVGRRALDAHRRASWGLPSMPHGRTIRTARITAYSTGSANVELQ